MHTKSLRPPALSQIFKACLLIRKAFAKFPERPWKSWPDHTPKIPETPTGVKWISILFNLFPIYHRTGRFQDLCVDFQSPLSGIQVHTQMPCYSAIEPSHRNHPNTFSALPFSEFFRPDSWATPLQALQSAASCILQACHGTNP